MFVDSYNAAGEDNFLSANGKSRKEKRAAKKAEKEEKLRQRKGAEISAAVQNQVGGVLGLPMMMPPPPAEEKKGLKKIVGNIKDKREQRQADKEEKLRQRKGAEISAAVQNQVGGVLGLPMMMPPPPAEEKKGLKKIVGNIKDKREQRQADKLFKKDYEKSKKEGTLSKGVGSVKNLIMGEDEEPIQKKKADSSQITRGVLMGISGALLVVVLMSIFKDKKAAAK